MKKSLRILSLALTLALGVTTLASCSNTPTVEKIQKDGKIIMMTNAAFPPFEYVEGSDIVGVDVDIANEIAKDLGVELEIQNMEFEGIVGAIASGKGTVGVAGMSITEERLENVDFSKEYIQSKLVVLVRNDEEVIKTPDDLVGKIISVQTGTTSDVFAAGIEGVTMQRYKNFIDAASALKSSKSDAVVVDEMTAAEILAANDDLRQLDDILTEEKYAICVKKGNETLLNAINETLDRLFAEGKIEEFIFNHSATEE